MLGFGKKKLNDNLLISVCPTPQGTAYASVRREKDVPPVLELYEYQPADEFDADLKRMVKTRDLDEALCISVMELGSYTLLQVEAPDVQPDELKAAIRWRIKDLIDFHIDDAVIDVFEVPDNKTSGKNRKMYVVAARAGLVRRQIDSLTGAGLRLEVIDIPEMALRNIAALLPEDAYGVALVYIENDEGLITITREGSLYLSRRIRFGYDALPHTAIHSDDKEVVESWLDNIVIEIQRSLDYYESHFAQPQVSGLVIMPGKYEIPGITEYLSAQLGLSTRLLNVNEIIDVQETLDQELQAKCLLAIGAALRQESRTL